MILERTIFLFCIRLGHKTARHQVLKLSGERRYFFHINVLLSTSSWKRHSFFWFRISTKWAY